MKSRMQCFALAAKCDFRGANGPSAVCGVAPKANPSRLRSPVSATPPKPAPISQRNSRRVPVQSGVVMVVTSAIDEGGLRILQQPASVAGKHLQYELPF